MSNAADAAEIKAKDKKIKLAEEQHIADMRAILAMPEGRRILWSILTYSRVFNSIFDPDSTVLSHNAGIQTAGQYVLAKITEADEDAFLLMMKESKEGSK